MPRVKKVARRRRDLKKRGPSGVENIEYPSFSDPPIIVGDDYEFTYFSPERNVRSPEQFSSEGAPIHILSKELGLPEVSKDDQSGLPHGAKSSPPLYMPKIFLGDASPAPRWLIRAVDSEADQGPVPRQSSISGGSRLPPLGRLRWEFDSGSSDKHGLDEAWLCDYAYQYLVNSLGDPIVRDQMRDLIWNGPHAPTVAHVEDPLPIPPPPPHFKEKKTLDYVTLQPPISATAPDDYYFMYPGYSRPPLATRPWKKRATDTNAESAARESDSYVTATTEFSPCSSGDHNHGYESRSGSVCRAKSGISANARTRASTSSSMSISPQDSKHTSGQDSDSPGYHPSSDDDDRHVSSDSSEMLKSQSPQGKPTVSNPPQRIQGRTKAKKVEFHAWPPTFNEASSQEDLSREGRGARRAARNRSASQEAWRPPSEAFSDDEGIILPKLPKRVLKKAAKR